jgi:hypothetical protein
MFMRISVSAAFIFTAGLLIGCGGGSSSTTTPPPPTITGTISGNPASLAAGATAMLTATVSGDSTNAGVDWTCSPATSCGAFNPTHTASGAATTYTAPATPGTVMITATSTANGKALATASITINAAPVAISFTGAPASLALNATTNLTATVTNDATNAGVDWTCAPTGTCGSFNPTHTASGASTVFTAPAAAASVTVTATATASSAATQSATIAVAAVSNVASLSGNYAFALAGRDASAHAYSLAGTVSLDGNGNVTAGEQDYNNGHGTLSPTTGDSITGGAYTVGSDGRGTLTLITNNTNLGTAGTENFSLVVVNGKHALLTQTDATGTASGTLDSQVIAGGLAQLTGTYSFTVAGANGNNPEVFGGQFVSNSAGAFTHVIVDSSSNGTVNKGGTNTGTYTAPDASGRGTFAFGGDNFVYYVIGPEALRLIVVDTTETDLGVAIGQGAGPFSKASLTGNFVFKNASAETGAASYASAGQLTTDGNGNITSGFADVDEAGTVTSAAFTGTYTLAANGYGSIAIAGGATQHVATLGVYAIDPAINPLDPNSATGGGGALILDLDAPDVGGGVLLPQAASSTFTGNYALAYRAFTPAGVEQNAVGQVAISNGSFTGTADANTLPTVGANLGVSATGTFTADASHAGRFTLPLTVSIGNNPPARNFVLYQASTGDLLWIETDTTQYVSGSIEQQHQ